jgi:hypothetical protein
MREALGRCKLLPPKTHRKQVFKVVCLRKKVSGHAPEAIREMRVCAIFRQARAYACLTAKIRREEHGRSPNLQSRG